MTEATHKARTASAVFEAAVWRERCMQLEAQNDAFRLRIIQLEDHMDGIGFTPPEPMEG